METLPQKDRDIARAFYLEGASYDELTSAHGLSDKAISFRLSRAKQQLSKRLRYLLTSVFVSSGLTLKKLYSGGLTTMRVGTVPKMTVGAAGLIGLIFIGFIVIRQMNASIVEERVYLSPWEDGTARPRNNPERFPTNTAQGIESWNNLPQIAATVSAETESVGDFFGEPDEIDMAQFATEMEFELDTRSSQLIVSSESTVQAAEDVMYAYLKAWRNSDFKVIDSLRTEQYRRRVHDNSGNEASINMSDEAPNEGIETMLQMLREATRELRKQTLLVSSEYAGTNFTSD